MDRRWFSEKGVVKLGQPVPLSNLAPALNGAIRTDGRCHALPFLVEKNAAEGCLGAVLEQHVPVSSSLRSATRPRSSSLLGGVRSNFGATTSFIPMLLVAIYRLKSITDDAEGAGALQALETRRQRVRYAASRSPRAVHPDDMTQGAPSNPKMRFPSGFKIAPYRCLRKTERYQSRAGDPFRAARFSLSL